MKVLMLGWELPPHNSGGLGVACYHLCKSLKNRDVSIEFFLPYKADHGITFMEVTHTQPQGVAEIQKSGIAYDSYKYVYANGDEKHVGIYEQVQMYEHAAAQLAETREFDLVHAHDWLTFRAALRIKEKRGCPIILHVHSVESDRAGSRYGNPLVHDIEEQALQIADRVIAVSQHTKNVIMRDYGIPADKIEVVHNSIEPDEIEPASGKNAYKYLEAMKPLGYRVVVSIGRLTVQKGLPNLLRAAVEVLKRHPKTFFLIVGSGEQYRELLCMAAELGIGQHVIFTNYQRGKNWRDAYSIGDLFVMPSVSEPFGLTPLEAAGYGTPSLVSKQSGVAEVLHNCLKVDFWDIDEMANQIAAVMENDALRDELIRNALPELERMTWDGPSEKVHHIYRQHHQGVAAR